MNFDFYAGKYNGTPQCTSVVFEPLRTTVGLSNANWITWSFVTSFILSLHFAVCMSLTPSGLWHALTAAGVVNFSVITNKRGQWTSEACLSLLSHCSF